MHQLRSFAGTMGWLVVALVAQVSICYSLPYSDFYIDDKSGSKLQCVDPLNSDQLVAPTQATLFLNGLESAMFCGNRIKTSSMTAQQGECTKTVSITATPTALGDSRTGYVSNYRPYTDVTNQSYSGTKAISTTPTSVEDPVPTSSVTSSSSGLQHKPLKNRSAKIHCNTPILT